MPDPIDPKAEVAKNNEEVIQKQSAQDISGQSANGPTNFDAISSLDALRDKKIEDAKKLVEPTDPPVEDPAKAAAPVVPDPAKATPDPAKAAPDATPVVPDPAAEAAAAEAAAKKAAEEAAVEKIFKDSPSLPPNASPKSGEAFASVKLTAAREISRLEAEKEALTKQVAEAQEKLKNPIPPELEQELKTLREFRAKLDVDADPKFKEFDKTIEAANEFIYAQLRKSPVVTDEILADIKKYGGPANVNMEKILDAVKDPLIRRLVESKLADVEMTRYQKEQALASTKTNVSKYLEDREKEWQNAAKSHNDSTKQNLEALTSKIEWLNPKTVDPKLDANAKAAIEAHNAYATQMRKELNTAISDDSPEMRATLLVGMVQLFRLQSAYESVTQKLTKAEADLKAANETVTKLKSASVSRLRESGAPTTATPQPKKGVDYTESAAEAVDRMRREKLQAQQAA